MSLRTNRMRIGKGFLFILAMLILGCAASAQKGRGREVLPIPTQEDWQDYGPLFQAGTLGEWDYQLGAGFSATAVKISGDYHLYYQGACCYRTTPDETVTWRAIGVATSPDGINFTKYPSNPIVTWHPFEGGEEGAVSSSATLDRSGEVVMFYGANTEQSATLVNADGRIATSANGIVFTDLGVVLDHRDDSVWGSGDELFPIIALHHAGRWVVYYIPNGTPERRQLGVAWGERRDDLSHSAAVQSRTSTIPVWGAGGYARLGCKTYALFLSNAPASKIEVRTVSLDTPYFLSSPVETYRFDGVLQATVLLDHETRTWFMYYHGERGYGVKLAPAGQLDVTPPTPPGKVTAVPLNDRQIALSWRPANDAETGIAAYRVFRNGEPLATVTGWHFSDTGLAERTAYRYEISAINYHGIEGPMSTAVTVTTLKDVTAPKVLSVSAIGKNQVAVFFNEPVDRTSAETAGHYAISMDMEVTKASLGLDSKTVVLGTSSHVDDVTYRLHIDKVLDRARQPNAIIPNTQAEYLYSAYAGLVGAWTFETGKGQTAFDRAAYGNDGTLLYTDKPGPLWINGVRGGALQFDGEDDQVTIDGANSLQDTTDSSYTYMAWANPEDLPPHITVNDATYSILVRQYTGLYYDHDGRFKARLRLAEGEKIEVVSPIYSPGVWHHLVMAVDDVNKTFHLYVDGREVPDSPVVYEGILADLGEAPYYIGTSDPLHGRYEYRFQGKIDEVQIYDRAIRPEETVHVDQFSMFRDGLVGFHFGSL